MAEEKARYALRSCVEVQVEGFQTGPGIIIGIAHRDEEPDYRIRMQFGLIVLVPESRIIRAFPNTFDFAKIDCKDYGAIEVEAWMDEDSEKPENAVQVLQDAINDYMASLKALQIRIQHKYGPLLDHAILNPSETMKDKWDITYPPETHNLRYS